MGEVTHGETRMTRPTPAPVVPFVAFPRARTHPEESAEPQRERQCLRDGGAHIDGSGGRVRCVRLSGTAS